MAALELVEALGRGEGGAGGFLDHGQRTSDEPAAGAGRDERLFGKGAPIGRIEEGERERRQRMRAAELGRIAPENATHAAQAQRGDVLPQQRARLGAVIDEQREGRAARERLEPERAGTGKEIEHARAADGIAIGVNENVEQRLAQPVGARPDRRRFRRGVRAAAAPPFVAPRALTDALGIAAAALAIRVVSVRLRRRRAAVARQRALADRTGKVHIHRDLFAELVAQGPRLDLDDRADRKLAELKRAERHPDQPIHLQAQMTENILDLAVLALADREGEPDIAALRAVERRLDRAIADAVDGDADGEPRELLGRDAAMRTDAVTPQP